MTRFKFSDQHIDEYNMRGLTVFRRILPPSLIRDLRRVCERGAEIVRQEKGTQVQRFQPVTDYDIDQKPFEDYENLPELREALSRVLSPDHTFWKLGVLINPQDLPWCTHWHRDARNFLDDTEWEFYTRSKEYFNQINCALYDDASTWLVPGSHLRGDQESEREAFTIFPPENGPDLEGKNYEERELLCLDYCEQMPGAQCVYLNPGDFALYRSSAWHLGNYTPYRKRATLHDGVMTPLAIEIWSQRMQKIEIPLEIVLQKHANAGRGLSALGNVLSGSSTH